MSNVPWEVFRGDPRPDDIRQGIVGNCWFVCALSALAEAPENLRRIVLTRSYSHAGAYQARPHALNPSPPRARPHPRRLCGRWQ